MRRRHAERLELKGPFFPPFHELESQLSYSGKPGNPGGVDRAFVIRTALGGKHPPRVLVGGPLVGGVGERGARLRSERQLDPVPGDLSGFGRRHDQVFGGWRRRGRRWLRRGRWWDRASVRASAAADVERDQPDEDPRCLAREATERGTRFTRPVKWAAGRTGPGVTVRCGENVPGIPTAGSNQYPRRRQQGTFSICLCWRGVESTLCVTRANTCFLEIRHTRRADDV